ncbi:MAG: hypothetical protein ABDH29_07985 [Aquificaceae bacterium]
MKEGRREKWLGYIISLLWIFSMALAGFFVPHFTDNITFFKVKALYIEGLETVPPDVVVEEVRNLKNNWLFINSDILLKNLNAATGNSISDLKVRKIFNSRGVELEIKVKERKPIFTAIQEDTVIFFDEGGTQFRSPYIDTVNPVVYTHNIHIIQENFENIRNIIHKINSDLKEIYVTNLGTIIYTKEGVKVTLPPLFSLSENLVENVAKLQKDYNITDMKEMEINTEGLVIIRGEKRR